MRRRFGFFFLFFLFDLLGFGVLGLGKGRGLMIRFGHGVRVLKLRILGLGKGASPSGFPSGHGDGGWWFYGFVLWSSRAVDCLAKFLVGWGTELRICIFKRMGQESWEIGCEL